MSGSLFDAAGNRKYLTPGERIAFVRAACVQGGNVGSFCLTLAITGARISEVLALTSDRIDVSNAAIVFETLKQRRRGIFRAIPAPRRLLDFIVGVNGTSETYMAGGRLWPWGRTTAWKQVKSVMKAAGISNKLCQPKALRHGFAIDAGQSGVPLNIIQRWLGHARIETTAIYSGAIGQEERNLARRSWRGLEAIISRIGRTGS